MMKALREKASALESALKREISELYLKSQDLTSEERARLLSQLEMLRQRLEEDLESARNGKFGFSKEKKV